VVVTDKRNADTPGRALLVCSDCMNIAFIVRGSLPAGVRGDLASLHESPLLESVQVVECEYAGHGMELARDAAATADCVVAVGGDGTLNEVVNGVLEFAAANPDSEPPAVGVLARGTANDFTKSLGVEGTIEELLALVAAGDTRTVDVGLLSFIDDSGAARRRYFINVADIGVGARVASIVNRRSRRFGAALTYLSSIVQGFLSYHKPLVEVVTVEGFAWRGRCLACVVGNGRAFGAGLYATPAARIDDGRFDCAVIGDVGLLEFFRYLPNLRHGETIRHDEVHYLETTGLQISSESGRCLIDADGESFVGSDVQVEIAAAALRLLAPPP
jgi:YegS/Rv2252/BmrU family lipid kinase